MTSMTSPTDSKKRTFSDRLTVGTPIIIEQSTTNQSDLKNEILILEKMLTTSNQQLNNIKKHFRIQFYQIMLN